MGRFPLVAAALAAGMAAAITAGCSTQPLRAETATNTGTGAGAGVSAGGPTVAVVPAAQLIVGPAAGFNPLTPITVTAQHATLTSVTVANSASHVSVTGSLSPDKTRWTSNEPLGYNASYDVMANATDEAGKPAEQSATEHTLAPQTQADVSLVPFSSGADVGVGQPVVVRFDTAVPDKAAAVKALHISTTPPQTGAWKWISSTEVHYRPQNYWLPGTTVALNAKLYGVDLGGGVYGQSDESETFHVHDAWVAKADGAAHSMQIFDNGQLVKTMPISLGEGDTPTHVGTHVISDRAPSVVMDSCTYGVCAGQPGYYKETVYLDERISNDGEYVHAAPWSVGQQGSSNVSHGCVNLSPANAQWFYDHFGIGDVVEVTNSGGPKLPIWDTYGDWELPWSQWQATG